MRILVTGGTGSFGQAIIRRLLQPNAMFIPDGTPIPEIIYPSKVIVFSRDELKQSEMRAAGLTDSRLRYFIGDVRDRDRLMRAFRNVDVVVHAAALKQVESCEYNPTEAVETNINGTRNVIHAATERGVGRVLMIGTDKAVDPVNLYGKTKAVAETLMVDANAESGGQTKFSCTRYGNVITSRGAVFPLFQQQHADQLQLTVTDGGMTRFVLTLDQAVQFVLGCLEDMRGGEVFVPKLPSVTVGTIAAAVTYPDKPTVVRVPRRPGEKTHELLISEHEAWRTDDHGERFVVHPITSENQYPLSFYGSNSPVVERLTISGFRELAGLV